MKNLYITIYLATIIDIIATVTGIKLGHIVEANPLLKKMNEYPLSVGIALILVIGFLLYFIYKQNIKIANSAMILVLIVKVYVLILHVNWISNV